MFLGGIFPYPLINFRLSHKVFYERYAQIISDGNDFFGADEVLVLPLQDVDVPFPRRGGCRAISNKSQRFTLVVFAMRGRTDGAIEKDSRSKRKRKTAKRIDDGVLIIGRVVFRRSDRPFLRTTFSPRRTFCGCKVRASLPHYASHPRDVHSVRIPSELVLGAQKILVFFLYRTR